MSSPCRNRLILLAAAAALAACNRQAPSTPPTAPNVTAVSTLFPGGGAAPALDPQAARYEGDPQAIADGKRLYETYNCVGCHFHGAGGIGPALMDDQWTYGGRIDQIVASIEQGRPNGMPSWAGKIGPAQVWQIAAYVRSLSGTAAAQPLASPGQPLPPPAAAPEATPQTVAIGDLKPTEATVR